MIGSDVLVALAEAYETKCRILDLPGATDVIKDWMVPKGLSAQGIDPIIDAADRVYSISHRMRALSLRMIRVLHQQSRFSAECVIRRTEEKTPVAGDARAEEPQTGIK